MIEIKTLNDRFDLRINDVSKKDYVEKCLKLKKHPQDLMREMMHAVVKGNLKITVDKNDLQLQQELYNAN